MALVGYVRVSTAAQDGALQRDALVKAGCSKLFEDKASGAKSDRPGLNDALAYIRTGDVLVVWKLDRLGRSLSHLIDTVTARGVGFKSLTEGVDTSTSNGRLVFHIFGSLADDAVSAVLQSHAARTQELPGLLGVRCYA
jgi:DNA invertase Pin-like site-specific DNA recombinase